MKKIIFIVSVLTVILLLNMPSIPAENLFVVKETNKSQLLGKLQNLNNKEFTEKLTMNIEQIKEKINEFEGKTVDNPPAQPSCLGLIYLLILYLIIYAIKLTFKAIFGVISGVITKIILIIATFIGLITKNVTKVINFIIKVITIIKDIFGKITGWTSKTLTELITILVTIIGLISKGISNIFVHLYNATGVLIRFILDVINLIYDIIFQTNPTLQSQ